MYIPGPGLVGHYDSLSGTRRYIVLGPMPVGSVVDTLRIAISCSGAASIQIIAIAAAIGSSHEGTLEALNVGRSLIRFSNVATVGPGSVTFGLAAGGGERRLEIPIGILIKGGPQYIIVGAMASIATSNTGMVASVSTLQSIGDATSNRPVRESE